MKKLILSLFLVLGLVSYSAPNFVETKRVEHKGYAVTQDIQNVYSFQKVDNEKAVTITYWYGLNNPEAKELNETLKTDATRDLRAEKSLKLGKAYVEKYTDGQGFLYTIVFKNAKPAEVLTSIATYTKKEIPNNELNKFVDKLLMESETFIK